jgi:hypothetical protein
LFLEESENLFGVAFGFYFFESVDEVLTLAGIRADEVSGAFDAFDELAVHVFGLDEVVAVDQDHVGVGEEVVGEVVFVFEFFLGGNGVTGDAENYDAGLLEFFESVAEAAGLDGAAGGIGPRVEKEDYGFASEVGKGDFFAVLILEGEIFYFVAGFHVGSFCGAWINSSLNYR